MPIESLQIRFHERFAPHQRLVYKIANAYAFHPEDRQDLVQEIVAQAWRSFPHYDDARSFSTWLYRIALNVAISYSRKSRRLEKPTSEFEVIDVGLPEVDERVETLRSIIERLDPLNKALLVLYLEERTYREIAEVLGISETNVASKLSRLKQRIRDEFPKS
jgi:RNA polymerase sigma-70 factor (ECF subfamily)